MARQFELKLSLFTQTISHVDQIEEISNEKMVITFPNRKGAEIAAIQGIDFNGKQLQLSWFTGQINKPTNTTTANAIEQPKIQRRVTRSLSQSLMEKDLEDDQLVKHMITIIFHSLKLGTNHQTLFFKH